MDDNNQIPEVETGGLENIILELKNEYDNLFDNYTFLEARFTSLETELSELKEKFLVKDKKAKKQKIKDTISLNDVKLEFIESKPSERTEPFSDVELAMWAVMLLAKTNRREIITSWPELIKRGKTAKRIVDFFIEKGYTEEEARIITKGYLEMVLTQYPTFKGKDGLQNMSYFTATSDFAIGHYSQFLKTWKQVKNLPDESLD